MNPLTAEKKMMNERNRAVNIARVPRSLSVLPNSKPFLDAQVVRKRYLHQLQYGGFTMPNNPDFFKAFDLSCKQYFTEILTKIVFNTHQRCTNYLFESQFKPNDDLKGAITFLNKVEAAERRNNNSYKDDVDCNYSMEQSFANETANLALGAKKMSNNLNVKPGPKPQPKPKHIVNIRDVIDWMEEDRNYRYSGLLDKLYYKDAST